MMKNPLLSNHLLFTYCVVLILVSSCCTATENDNDIISDQNGSSSGICTAPLNPAFVEYQQETEEEQNSVAVSSNDLTFSSLTLPVSSTNDMPSETLDHPTGLIPSPVDLSHLSPVSMDSLLADDTIRTSGLELMGSEVSFPAQYDLRDVNGVTAVRNQGYAGSCWAHSATASLESFLLHNRSETWDFSENNLKNVLSSSYPDGYDRTHDDGGFDLYPAAYYTRWSGPVRESDDPYDASSGVSPDNLPVVKHVQEILILPGFEGDDPLYKSMLMEYGAISVAMWYGDSYFDYTNNSYYYDGPVEYANHAITLVGWDDDYAASNFTPKAPGNGAFIIKNSWGDNWGEDGYFYLSYYDTVMGNDEGMDGIGTRPYLGNFLYTAEDVNNYDHIYQYDPLGWACCIGYNNSTAYGANVFTASSHETLEAVSFYTVDSNSFYNISIYLNPESGPVNISGPLSVQNGTIPMAGYHTIDLDTNVSLSAGQNFSVVVQFMTPNYDYPIAVEYPIYGYSNADAEPGQSYMSSDGNEWEDVSVSEKNICIKAFTTEERGPESSFYVGSNYVYVNETVDFKDISLFSPNTWEWDFGDGSTSSEQNPSHVYTSPGFYDVSLNVSNSFGSNVSTKNSVIYVSNSTLIVNSSDTSAFSTINGAVDLAQDGDTILVESGVYNERVTITENNVTLVSSTGNPADVRIICNEDGYAALDINADNITILGITASNGYFGIALSSSQGCNISNCIISENDIGFQMLSSSLDNILKNNSMLNNTINSRFGSHPNDVDTSNTVDGKPIYYLVDVSDLIVDASSNAGVVYLFNCSNLSIRDLYVENNAYGLYLENSNNVTISNCTSDSNSEGISLYSSYNNVIEDCNINNTHFGGLSLLFSFNNTIEGCTISDSSPGIDMYDSADNLIYNNYFNNSDNTDILLSGFNQWNITRTSGTNVINGSYLGGNFWAKPDGTGWSQTEYSVGNGFCDIYEITEDGNNTDYLPLTLNSVQPTVSDESSSNDNGDGIHVKIATPTSSTSGIVATDSSVCFVGRDAEVEYVFTDGSTPVNEISFESEINEGYVMASVSLLDGLPESSPAPSSATVYQGMEILLGDEEFSSGIGDAKISFSVSKEWLESNGFDESDIFMEHFSEDVWDILPTVVTGEDDEYFYFEATTTGFSPFMICVDTSGESQVTAGSSLENTCGDAVSENIVPDSPQDSGQSGDNPVNTLTIISGLIVVTVLGLVVKMKKPE
ncbi:lectin like domain-containing protein [Methanolobus vulcani]|uniref:PGF-pre-PGF domain-containing protein n=1 Tax=Methanolobus vulcani TaxID=38026 RepID=A0A7Z8P5E2_9EURY|nr:lectin like domain-containing protein [Methanolobus vulcani]TQD28261.1 PGF-pre-PGF domain-containing protein [Methanolobus vulcani]